MVVHSAAVFLSWSRPPSHAINRSRVAHAFAPPFPSPSPRGFTREDHPRPTEASKAIVDTKARAVVVGPWCHKVFQTAWLMFTNWIQSREPSQAEPPHEGDKKILVLDAPKLLLPHVNAALFNTGHRMYHFDKVGFKFDIATQDGAPWALEERAFPTAVGYEDQVGQVLEGERPT